MDKSMDKVLTSSFSGWTKIRTFGKIQLHYILSVLWMITSTLFSLAAHKQIYFNDKFVEDQHLELKRKYIGATITCTSLTVIFVLVETLLHVGTSMQLLATNWGNMRPRQFFTFGYFSFIWRLFIGTTLVLTLALAAKAFEDPPLYAAALAMLCVFRFSVLELCCYNRVLTTVSVEYKSI